MASLEELCRDLVQPLTREHGMEGVGYWTTPGDDALLGMSPEIVRYYGKRSQALMIAREVAEKVTGATLHIISGPRSLRGTK